MKSESPGRGRGRVEHDDLGPVRWIDVEAWYGYSRGYWLTYATFALLVAHLFVYAALAGDWPFYLFPIAAAYALGWGHGIVMEGDEKAGGEVSESE